MYDIERWPYLPPGPLSSPQTLLSLTGLRSKALRPRRSPLKIRPLCLSLPGVSKGVEGRRRGRHCNETRYMATKKYYLQKEEKKNFTPDHLVFFSSLLQDLIFWFLFYFFNLVFPAGWCTFNLRVQTCRAYPNFGETNKAPLTSTPFPLSDRFVPQYSRPAQEITTSQPRSFICCSNLLVRNGPRWRFVYLQKEEYEVPTAREIKSHAHATGRGEGGKGDGSKNRLTAASFCC